MSDKKKYNSYLLEEKLDTILKKSKYLYLAHYLEKNRGDWSSGYNYAKTGILGFSVESELDGMIWEEIEGLIFEWNGDGRCFRDCEYNYNFLYKLVDSI